MFRYSRFGSDLWPVPPSVCHPLILIPLLRLEVLMSNSPTASTVDPVMIPLNRLPVNEAGQTRAMVRGGVVRAYAVAMKEQLAEGGLRFPAVIVVTDGQGYWVGGGFHRIPAGRQAGLTEIAAEVRHGGQREALLFGILANGEHGLPRTPADKRKAVGLLLADPEWNQWSDREIARHCHVSNFLVSKLRRGASVSES